MSDNLVFQPNNTENIAFYVSNDGEQVGMSIKGLARCCGVVSSSIRRLLTTKEGGIESVPKFLKPFNGEHFIVIGVGAEEKEESVKVIKSSVCASVIEYYAFESKSKNDVALNCYRSFAKLGIENWIKNVVGFNDKAENEKVLSTLSLILKEVQQIKSDNEKFKPIVAKYTNFKSGVKTTFPGLDDLIKSIEDERHQQLASAEKLTLSDWLRNKNILLSNGGYCAFGRMVSECYKAVKMEEPKKGNMKKANGKWSMNVRLYSQKDYPILEMALKQFLSKSA